MIKNEKKSASIFGKMKNLVDFNKDKDMINSSFCKNSILYMCEPIIISQDIQLVDSIFRGNMPSNVIDGQNINIINPFAQVSNIVLLKKILKKDAEEIDVQQIISNPIEQSFSFNGFLIKNINVPPRLLFSKDGNTKSMTELQNLAKNIVIECEIKNKIGAVGMNYKLYLDNTDNKFKLNEKILNSKITQNFENCNATISTKIDEFTMLNMKIADAIIQNLDKTINAIYIDANFHTDIFGSNTFEKTIEKDFFKELSDKIDIIFK